MFRTIAQVRSAFSLLSPDAVRKRVQHPVAIGLVAADEHGYAELEDFLVPRALPDPVRRELLRTVHRAGATDAPSQVELVLYAPGIPCPRGAYTYRRGDPLSAVHQILGAEEHLALALARHYPVFRGPVVERTIQAVSRENALFAVASALPNVVPTLFELPWAVSEFASDTVFLTLNQFRMAFLIAGACGASIGFSRQKAELLSIAAGALGWRALARELVGKIPLGGGLIPKGAIAYAATFAIGKGLAYYHARTPYTPAQREAIYQQALVDGKVVAAAAESELRQ